MTRVIFCRCSAGLHAAVAHLARSRGVSASRLAADVLFVEVAADEQAHAVLVDVDAAEADEIRMEQNE